MMRRLILGHGVAFAVALSLACANGDTTTTTDERAGADERAPAERASGPGAPDATGTTSVDDITGDPATYVGRTVTVEADVEEVWSPYAFSLDEDAVLTGGLDNDLLVFSPKSGQLASIDDQWRDNRVRVTGDVRRMSVVEIEREIGWDLDPEIEAELEEVKPVLIARSIQRIDQP